MREADKLFCLMIGHTWRDREKSCSTNFETIDEFNERSQEVCAVFAWQTILAVGYEQQRMTAHIRVSVRWIDVNKGGKHARS